MSDSTVSTIHWSSLKYLLMYMHVLDWNDEFFTKWKKLCAELNDCKSLLLWSYFCITTMLNSRTSLLIKNDFLMLYCRIHRKDCFIIKLFITVVDSAMRSLFVCFQLLKAFLTFWLNISESAQMLSRLSCYSRKRKDQFIFSWFLLSVRSIHQQLNCMFLIWLLLSLRNSLNWKSSLNLKSLLNLKSSEIARSMCNCI